MDRTYDDVLKLRHALGWLGNQKAGERAKASSYNTLNLRLQLATEAYRPIFTAIDKLQREIFEKYELMAGDDVKNLENGNVTFGAKLDRQYTKEVEAALEMPVEDEPRRRPFKLSDFDMVGIAVPQIIMDELGPLLEKPVAADPDILTDDDIERVA